MYSTGTPFFLTAATMSSDSAFSTRESLAPCTTIRGAPQIDIGIVPGVGFDEQYPLAIARDTSGVRGVCGHSDGLPFSTLVPHLHTAEYGFLARRPPPWIKRGCERRRA